MATDTSGIEKLYIAGRWVEGSGELTVTDPGTGEVVAKVATVGRDETRSALETAREAWPAWRKTTGRDRGDILLRAASVMKDRLEEIAVIITRENGKPLSQSRGEVNVAIDHFRWFAEEARRGYGRIVPPQADGKRHMILKEPVGVVAAISPWNFPLVLSARKVAPALAAGCPVVLRPSSKSPLSALAMARALDEAGIPQGVFQLVLGPASEIVDEFLENPICRKLTFTGSTKVGKDLIRKSATTVTNLSLELGGHAPIIVFGDADIDAALDGVLITKFRNSGQSCIASNRTYVERSIYPEFLQRLAEKTRGLKVGYGLEDGVDVGPLIDEMALKSALNQVKDAIDRGAKLVCGGKALDRQGVYLEPTVLADVPSDSVCMMEESFAPLAPVVPFDTEEEVIAAANDTRYGLAAYVFTRDLARGFRMSEALEAGSVGLNDAVPSTSNCPFGGMKESGSGRELGIEGMDAFMETKHVSIGGIS
ncbi:MAG: NAD-dependent succinate-semialdehyde dehydrogenase [Spirochaetaceae bacterium]|nr:NAD-dependent succinate-semialdehyde dehydrogenase [Spirochaetaceae bacterium]